MHNTSTQKTAAKTMGDAEKIIRLNAIKGPSKATMDAIATKTYAKLNAARAKPHTK